MKLTTGRIRVLLATIILGSLVGIVVPTHARQDPKPAVINQGWKVVPDISPKNLQEELEKLNKAGYTVTTDAILVVGDTFTILVNDNHLGDGDEDSGGGK